MPDFEDFGREISKIWPKRLFQKGQKRKREGRLDSSNSASVEILEAMGGIWGDRRHNCSVEVFRSVLLCLVAESAGAQSAYIA
jgi:hypothetical protein